MRIILEPEFNVSLDRLPEVNRLEEELGMDSSFDLYDSVIYAIDYGEKGEDGKITTNHNNIKIIIEE